MFEAEIEITCISSKGKELKYFYETEIECSYSTRVERCHGYHVFFDADENEYAQQCEIAKEKFIEEVSLDEITSDLVDELDEDETIIEVR